MNPSPAGVTIFFPSFSQKSVRTSNSMRVVVVVALLICLDMVALVPRKHFGKEVAVLERTFLPLRIKRVLQSMPLEPIPLHTWIALAALAPQSGSLPLLPFPLL